jgi:hypothetical protein
MASVTEFLNKHGLTLADIGKKVALYLELQEDEWLFTAGSLVENLGNDFSDLDVYVVSDCPQRLFDRTTSLAIDVDGIVVDLEVYGAEELDELVERFQRWALKPRVLGNCFGIAERERLHLHRLANAIPIGGNTTHLERIQEKVAINWLARHKLDWAIAWISTLQVDLEGLRQVKDWETMLPISNDVLGYTVDALLAASLKTNPTTKWRFPLLRMLPPDWEDGIPGLRTKMSALGTILELFRTPPILDPESVYKRVLDILAFSRRILPWAEFKLLGSGCPLPGVHPILFKSYKPPIGQLGVGVQIGYRDGRFRIFSLTSCSYSFDVSTSILALLCLFDGISTDAHAHSLINFDVDQLKQVQSLVRFGGFCAEPFVEPEAINKLCGVT